MREEIWKPVVGYEDRYEVSNFGRVRRLVFGKGGVFIGKKLMYLRKDGYGYYAIRISINSELKELKVHRLVAQAQNLIGISPAVSGAERVELPAVVGAEKREYVQFTSVS